jgi:hypothetical protein
MDWVAAQEDVSAATGAEMAGGERLAMASGLTTGTGAAETTPASVASVESVALALPVESVFDSAAVFFSVVLADAVVAFPVVDRDRESSVRASSADSFAAGLVFPVASAGCCIESELVMAVWLEDEAETEEFPEAVPPAAVSAAVVSRSAVLAL